MYRSDDWLRGKLRPLLPARADFEPLLQWVHAARQRPPVLFVGAGMSLNAEARVPGRRMARWDELIKSLQDDLPTHTSTASDPLWTAERYRLSLGNSSFYRKILEAVPDKDMEPGSAHAALTNIPWHSVLTLNFDTLLERAFQDAARKGSGISRVPLSIVEESQLSHATLSSHLPIIHLHGHIERPNSIILALEDFRRYPQTHAAFVAITTQLLLQHPVLLIGFGATDPNFIAWSGWIKDRVGSHAPPWVRLDYVGTRPRDESSSNQITSDLGFEAFWGPRLRSTPYYGDDLKSILDTLTLGLSELKPSDDEYEYLEDLADLVHSQAADRTKLERTRTLLDEIDKISAKRKERVDVTYKSPRTIQRALETIVTQSTSSPHPHWSSRTREQIEEAEHPDNLTLQPSKADPRKEPRDHLKDRFDTRASQLEWITNNVDRTLFAKWLTLAVRHYESAILPIQISTDREEPTDATFDARSELKRLTALNQTLPSQSGELAATLGQLEDQIGALEPDDTKDVYFDLATETETEAGAIAGLSAMKLRRLAALNVVRGDHPRAAELYGAAADRSVVDDEPDWLRYETARAAVASVAIPGNTNKSWAPNARYLSLARQAAAPQLLAIQNEYCGPARFWLGKLRSKADRAIARSKWNLEVTWRSEPLRERFHRARDAWLHPRHVREFADDYANACWDSGEFVRALEIWINHAVSGFEKRLELHDGRTGSGTRELVDVAVRRRRHREQEVSRYLALGELASDVRRAEVDSVLGDICFDPPGHGSQPTWAGRRLVESEEGPIAVISLLQHLPWKHAQSHVERVLKSQAPGVRPQQLPFSKWVRDASPDDIERWMELLRSFRTIATEPSPVDAANIFLNLLAIVPAGSQRECVRTHLETLGRDEDLFGAPRNDGSEWIRTLVDLETDLGGSRGRGRAKRLRGRERDLRDLIGTLHEAGGPLDPATVHAWLHCEPHASGDVAKVAHRALDMLKESRPSNPFGPDRFLESAIGKLVNLLSAWPSSSLDSRTTAALLLSFPWAVPEAAGPFATRVFPLEIEHMVSSLLRDPTDIGDESLRRRIFLETMRNIISLPEPGALPMAYWLQAVIALTGAAQGPIAALACKVVGESASRRPAPGKASKWERTIGRRMTQALLEASRDERADVVGSALRAMTKLDDAECRARVDEVRGGADDRCGVMSGLD